MDKYNKAFLTIGNFIILLWLTSACSHNHNMHQSASPILLVHNPIRLENYIESLADALVLNSHIDLKSGRLAIGTILLQEQLKANTDQYYPFDHLGTQIQEGITSYLMKRGITVVEYRKTNDIVIRNDYDQMLSRDLSHLKSELELHYYLTGTISYENNDAQVSLKIIDIASNEIFASAYKNIPINITRNSRQVIGHNGFLYRDSGTY